MNAAHVVALIYKIESKPSVDFSKAEPLDTKDTDFRVTIRNQQVRFEFTKHYATVDAAQEAIEDYINDWEFSACLENGPNYFKLVFDRVEGHPSPVRWHFKVGEPTVTVSPPCYPPPPSGLKLTPDVRTMYERYMGYLRGREPLPSMANFCWTMVEKRPVIVRDFTKGDRNVIGYLCSESGGNQARKAEGVGRPLTDEESRFLQKAIKVVIRRAAEEGLCLHSQSRPNIDKEPKRLKETLLRWQ